MVGGARLALAMALTAHRPCIPRRQVDRLNEVLDQHIETDAPDSWQTLRFPITDGPPSSQVIPVYLDLKLLRWWFLCGVVKSVCGVGVSVRGCVVLHWVRLRRVGHCLLLHPLTLARSQQKAPHHRISGGESELRL